MSDRLTQRLNEILPRITSQDFLSGQGIGNEVPFYIFDYAPEDELRVREHLAFVEEKLPKQVPGLKFVHVNLLDLLISYLEHRNYYERALKSEREQGSPKAIKAIKSVANAEKLADYFAATILNRNPELVLVSGVGSAYPIVRSHELLSNLQRHTGSTPLVMFYPGIYDKLAFKLFGKASLAFDSASSDRKRKAPYYRAFRLID